MRKILQKKFLFTASNASQSSRFFVFVHETISMKALKEQFHRREGEEKFNKFYISFYMELFFVDLSFSFRGSR
jgi:hypothetical protein